MQYKTNGIHPRQPKGEERGNLDVSRIYDGARLFVLGGTGFLGKVLVAMLLDRFPNIGHIFLLVRAKKDKSSEERFFSETTTSEAFRPLRERYGGQEGLDAFFRSKITAIDGDVGKPLCGVSEPLIKELRGTIDAVVNVAGVVDFNPPLDEALDANAFGAQNLVDFARALGDCPLLHTSTCYVLGVGSGPIEEVHPLERPFPRCEELGRELWNAEREIADCLDVIAQARHRCDDAFRQSEFLEKATNTLKRRGEPTEGAALEAELVKVRRKWIEEKLVEAGVERATHWGWPNTYTYTKSLGEQIIAKSGLPFAIGRPACCETTTAFPFEGWNEGMSTTVPFIFLAMKGNPYLPGKDTILDLIPSDMVCAGMVLTLAELIEGTNRPVYHYGAGDVNPCTAARYGELIGLYKRRAYQKKGGNPIVNFFQAHIEPAVVTIEQADRYGAGAIAKLAQAGAEMLKAAPSLAAAVTKPAARALEDVATQQRRVAHILHLFAPFSTTSHGPFSCASTRAAHDRLPDEWKAKLPFLPHTIDWADWFVRVHMAAVEKWILPDIEQRMKRELKPLQAHETLIKLLDQMADRHAHASALSYLEDDGFTRITYEEVRARANSTAARLFVANVKKGDRVVLSARNHPDWAIAYFGVLRAGATVVPIDPELEPSAIENVVRESGAKIALFDAHVRERAGHVAEVLMLDAVTAPGGGAAPDVDIEEDDLASLIYTSGTTGKPKGVRLSHRNFASLIAALAPIFPLSERDRVLSLLPLHHTFEFTCGLLLPFSRGARICYVGELSSERVNRGMKQGRPTAMVGVPALWQLLERRVRSQIDARGAIAKAAFEFAADANRRVGKALGIDAGKILFGPIHEALGGSLRILISGGAALPKETQELFASLGLHLTEGYGLTEAAPVLTVSKPSPRSPAGQVGKPIPGVDIKIDSPDESGVGEVLARGPNVMEGYTDADATSLVLRDGWLHTGDLGKLDKRGRLQIVGRIKDVIVTTTGENVYPDDVERSLGEIAGIEELAVVGIDSPKGGERVACLAVPKEMRESLPPLPASPDDGPRSINMRADRNERAMAALRGAIARLPYNAQPSICHLYDAPLPRTATRKVKRNEVQAILRRLIAATQPTRADASAHGPVRTAIAAVSGRGISEVHAGALLAADLGFDSLMLTELLEALETRGRTLDPQALQACRTVSDVEELFTHGRGKGAVVRQPARIEGKRTALEDVRLPPQVQDAAKSFIGRLQDVFYGQMMKPCVFGEAFIPHNRNTIVVANHASHLDMGFIRHALGKYGEDIVSLAASDYFFDQGIKRAFFENFTNLKSIDRKGGMRQSLRQASEVIAQGHTILIFPEGTRSDSGDVQEFKPMVGHLALTHKVDILPIYIGGTHTAMPKGSRVPTSREITARIGLPLCVADLQRLTQGKVPAEAAREVARLARTAVMALRDGDMLDLRNVVNSEDAKAERPHPLVGLFEELGTKFKPQAVDRAMSFYFTLGSDDLSKWTVLIDAAHCEIKTGKPAGGVADCVLKTSPEIFTRIVREAYVPGVAEFLSGAVKSNDVELLQTFQRAFQLT